MEQSIPFKYNRVERNDLFRKRSLRVEGRGAHGLEARVGGDPGHGCGLAKAFYTEKVGFNADHDHTVSDEVRFVQLTPPGSACSIAIGKGVVDSEPGSVKGMQLVVPDVDAARRELLGRGVEVSEVWEGPGGRFVFFGDPDGNRWAVQEIG